MSFVVTGRVRRVFARADAEARAHGHPYLAPEHILLSLAGRPDPQIATVLFNLGISGTRLRQTVSDLIGAGDGPAPDGPLTWTPEALDVVTEARSEVRRLGHRFVAPQHLLLGLVHEPATVAGQVLAQFGAGLAEVRREVASLPVPLRQRIPWRWRTFRPQRPRLRRR